MAHGRLSSRTGILLAQRPTKKPNRPMAERLELARRYLGAEGGDAYIAANPGGSQVMIRMTPERWLSVDYGRA